jgi:hypothetical protein
VLDQCEFDTVGEYKKEEIKSEETRKSGSILNIGSSALCVQKMWYNKEKASLRNSSSFSRNESMSLIA